MNGKKGVERITELFEFLMRNIVDECVKTKIESQWAKAVPLNNNNNNKIIYSRLYSSYELI